MAQIQLVIQTDGSKVVSNLPALYASAISLDVYKHLCEDVRIGVYDNIFGTEIQGLKLKTCGIVTRVSKEITHVIRAYVVASENGFFIVTESKASPFGKRIELFDNIVRNIFSGDDVAVIERNYGLPMWSVSYCEEPEALYYDEKAFITYLNNKREQYLSQLEECFISKPETLLERAKNWFSSLRIPKLC